MHFSLPIKVFDRAPRAPSKHAGVVPCPPAQNYTQQIGGSSKRLAKGAPYVGRRAQTLTGSCCRCPHVQPLRESSSSTKQGGYPGCRPSCTTDSTVLMCHVTETLGAHVLQYTCSDCRRGTVLYGEISGCEISHLLWLRSTVDEKDPSPLVACLF